MSRRAVVPGLVVSLSVVCLVLLGTEARPDPSMVMRNVLLDPWDPSRHSNPSLLLDPLDPSRPCLHYEGDGCSIPFGLPFFYKRQFTLSCDRHDVCYHCGNAYNISRPRCDHAFRRNTLSTCRAEYLAPTSPQPGVSAVYSALGPGPDAHKQRFLQVVEERGMGSLGILLEKELSALERVHPGPSHEQIQTWFSAYEVQVRMLAEWVELLAKYLHEGASEQTLPVESAGASSRDGDVDTNWCMEVAKYLDAHNKTLPPSSGMVCADIEYLTCNFFSELYFLAVRLFADSSYLRPAEFYCHESWVPKCLPQDSPSTVLRFKPQG